MTTVQSLFEARDRRLAAERRRRAAALVAFFGISAFLFAVACGALS